MAYISTRRVSLGAMLRAPFAALQWRLLLFWLLFFLLPAAVVSLPLWRALGELLDHSVHAPAWASSFNAMMFGDVMAALGKQDGGLHGAALAGLLVTVLLLPLLNGMVVASGRAGRALGFSHLLQSGIIEYGRMFRLMLWSVLPYAIAIGGAALAFGVAHKQAAKAVLESQADAGAQVAMWVLGVLFVLAHAVLESARGAFIADLSLRSATRALGRGIVQLLRRPLSTLIGYLVISAIGYLVLLAFGMGRIHTPAVGLGGFLLALLLSQLAVATMGWTHAARIFALAEVAASLQPSRRAGGLPPAL
jgi:hypothetical protein